MRNFLRLGIIASCLLAPSVAAADDSGWYLGYGLGLSHASASPALSSQSLDYQFQYFTESSDVSTDKGSMANHLEGGYWFNPHVGVQGSVVDLGRYTDEAHVHADALAVDCLQGCSFSFIDSTRVKVRGETLSATVAWPLSSDVDFIGRIGLFWNQLTYDDEGDTPLTKLSFPPARYRTVKSNLTPSFGISLGWNFKSHWVLLAGLDQYQGLGDQQFGKFNVTLLSLGIQYHF